MNVAIGWRIDDDLQPLALSGQDIGTAFAILRADVDAGIGGRRTASNIGKFTRIIAREQHVVTL